MFTPAFNLSRRRDFPQDQLGRGDILARLRAVGNIFCARGDAGFAQRCAERLAVGERRGLRHDRPATDAECLEGGQRIVVGPARHRAPGQRHVLAFRKLQRPDHRTMPDRDRLLVRRSMRTVRGTRVDLGDSESRCCNQPGADPCAEPHSGPRRMCAGRVGLTGRFPSQPASSSDRARRCHGRTSRHL